jgi:2-isopropylmalate synthase
MAYQPFDPNCVGNKISFIFGPLSGSNHAQDILEKNGFICPSEEKIAVAQALKDLYADRRKGVTDEELIMGYHQYRAPIKIDEITYAKNEAGVTTLNIKGDFFAEREINIYCDDGNSALGALDNAVKKHFPMIEIMDYRSNACAGNTVDAKCASTIVISVEGSENYIGKAVDADINLSAIKAYINAVNQAYVNKYYKKHEAEHA